MANLFEKPIAANPISEFAALPLDFIYNAVQTRQKKHDEVKADIDAAESSLLKLKFLPGDRDRHMEIQGGYEQEMEDMIDAAGGDYSLIQAPLDRLKRKIQKDIAYGEIGAQQNAYTSAMKDYGVLNEQSLKGELHPGAMALFNKSMNEHRTSITDSGGFKSFGGYNPSGINNISDHLISKGKDITDKYGGGKKFVTAQDVMSNIDTHMTADPNIKKSFQESYITSGMADKMTLQEYTEYIAQGVARTIAYEQNLNAGKGGKGTGAAGDMGTPIGQTIMGVQQPFLQGSGSYSGGSLDAVKEKIQDWSGLDGKGDFDKWKSSSDGQGLIKRLEKKTNTKFPTTHSKQVSWLDDNLGQSVTGNIVTRQPTKDEMLAFDTKGQSTFREAPVYGLDGSRPAIEDVEGTAGDMKAQVTGVIDNAPGIPPGSIMFVGSDGGTYVQENTSLENITSNKYLNWQLNKVEHTNSWSDNVQLQGALRNSNGAVVIPKGNYETEYIPGWQDDDGTQYPSGVKVKVGGDTKYFIYTDDRGAQQIVPK